MSTSPSASASAIDTESDIDDYIPNPVFAEIAIYERQNHIIIAKEQRRAIFRKKIDKLVKEFENEEMVLKKARIYPFLIEIETRGIEKARQETIPVYSFTRFLELPKELQLRIWNIAARFVDPRTYSIPQSWRYQDDETCVVFNEIRYNSDVSPHYPVILWVCQESRQVAEKCYCLMKYRIDYLFDKHTYVLGYVNILYDNFKMFMNEWDQYDVLVDMEQKLDVGSGVCLMPSVEANLYRFSKIRYLTIDIAIFAKAPPAIWTLFSDLVVLTIGFYPYECCLLNFNNHLRGVVEDHMHDSKLVKPPDDSLFGRRAAWLRKETLKVIRKAQLQQKDKSPIDSPNLTMMTDAVLIDGDEDNNRDWYDYVAGEKRVKNVLLDENISMSTNIFSHPETEDLDDHEEEIDKKVESFPTQDLEWYRNVHAQLVANEEEWKPSTAE